MSLPVPGAEGGREGGREGGPPAFFCGRREQKKSYVCVCGPAFIALLLPLPPSLPTSLPPSLPPSLPTHPILSRLNIQSYIARRFLLPSPPPSLPPPLPASRSQGVPPRP